MNSIILACRTLEDEIELAKKNTGCEYPVIYIESGLHERPKKLAEAVREVFSDLDKEQAQHPEEHAQSCDGPSAPPLRVLMALGQCGNALTGIAAGNFELILPKVDDCLSLLIGSNSEKTRINLQDKAFFLTMGWLKGESTIMSQYKQSVEKYGEDVALSIMEMMYEHYETMGLIDTGAAPIEKLWDEAEEITTLLGLKRKVYKGTISYVEELLTGPWPAERFIVKKPGEAISDQDFR